MAETGLSVCMIVRDERRNLEEVLPALVEGADEVVVVDTGSTDGSAELARAAGARVVEDPWREDFSRARNRGLDEVTASHVLWLDADDRIAPEGLAAVREACRRRPGAAFHLLLVNESADPNGVTSCWQLRVFPARPEHRFSGRVHEQVVEAIRSTGTPTERLDVTVRHTGYVLPGEVLRKARRNLELLRKEGTQGREDVNVLYHWVKAAHQCGELEEAARVARRLVEAPPQGTPLDVIQSAAVTLGGIEFQRGRREEAERVLRAAVDRVPDDPIARFFLGDLLRRGGDFEAALQELEAARRSPVRQGNLPLPVLGLRRAIRLQLGEVLETLGRPAEAVAVYREARAEAPGDRRLGLSLARALVAAGACREAEAELDRLGDAEEDRAQVLLLRATVAFDRGRDEEAERFFARAFELLPRTWAAPLHLGHLALRGGRVEEALRHYEKALRLADTPETRVGIAAGELEAGRPAAALEHLAAAVEGCRRRALPPGTEALAGEALLRVGRAREAVGAFERHLGRAGPDPRILARLADAYRALGAPEAARLGYREALKLEPGLAEARQGLEALEASA